MCQLGFTSSSFKDDRRPIPLFPDLYGRFRVCKLSEQKYDELEIADVSDV
jgi:hypothetical protein